MTRASGERSVSEANLWAYIRERCARYGDFKRVENPIGGGMPDVNYCIFGGYEGWIELKWVPNWPVDPEDTLKIKHYTPEQRTWAIDRTLFGGRVFLFLGVASVKEFLLFEGDWAARHVGLEGGTRVRLIEGARRCWTGTLPAKELVLELCK